MEKNVIDRRIAVLEEEGIIFKTNAHVGENIDANQLKDDFDAVVLCGGATVRRSIPIPGADLKGVTQAMDFLKLNNQYVDGLVDFKDVISAKEKTLLLLVVEIQEVIVLERLIVMVQHLLLILKF